MGRFKANREVPTQPRSTAEARDAPARRHRTDDERGRWHVDPLDDAELALLPWNFKARSETIKRYGAGAHPGRSTVADWPFSYDDLEPYYDKVEYQLGVSGQAGNVKGKIDPRGNVFEGPRSRALPAPAAAPLGLDGPHATRREALGWKPYPGPAGIREQVYRDLRACTYCGFCGWTGC